MTYEKISKRVFLKHLTRARALQDQNGFDAEPDQFPKLKEPYNPVTPLLTCDRLSTFLSENNLYAMIYQGKQEVPPSLGDTSYNHTRKVAYFFNGPVKTTFLRDTFDASQRMYDSYPQYLRQVSFRIDADCAVALVDGFLQSGEMRSLDVKLDALQLSQAEFYLDACVVPDVVYWTTRHKVRARQEHTYLFLKGEKVFDLTRDMGLDGIPTLEEIAAYQQAIREIVIVPYERHNL